MSDVTQKDVELLSRKIRDNIINDYDFIMKNYTILKKKNCNTKQELVWLKNTEDNNLFYQSPESIELFIDTLCFYIALETLGVPYEQW
jgi:hypothetical protein